MLKENKQLITEEKNQVMNKLMLTSQKVQIIKDNNSLLNSINYQNISDVLKKFKNYPSVHKIRQTF